MEHELPNKVQSEDQESGWNHVTRQPTLSKVAAGCTVWGRVHSEQSLIELHDSPPKSRYRKYFLWAVVLAMSPCHWPLIGHDSDVRQQSYCKKATLASNLGEADTCRWELSTMFWMSRQSRTDKNPPSELFELKQWIFLSWMCFGREWHHVPKDPDYIITYRSIHVYPIVFLLSPIVLSTFNENERVSGQEHGQRGEHSGSTSTGFASRVDHHRLVSTNRLVSTSCQVSQMLMDRASVRGWSFMVEAVELNGVSLLKRKGYRSPWMDSIIWIFCLVCHWLDIWCCYGTWTWQATKWWFHGPHWWLEDPMAVRWSWVLKVALASRWVYGCVNFVTLSTEQSSQA